MSGEVEILCDNPSAQQFQISFDSHCPTLESEKANQAESEAFDVITILNLENNAKDSNKDVINIKKDLVLKLKEINISCALTELPKVIFDLKYLTVLNLSNNLLQTLPKEIGNLCNLTVLNLSCNRLSCLPKSLKHAQQLNYLNLSRNCFCEVPGVLYYGVRALQTLDLSFNEITTFNEFPGCVNKLVVLNMANNLLKELPFWVFDTLCQLQFLYVGGNHLKLYNQFANCCSTGIFKSLQLLNVENCSLSYESIQVLPLFKNLSVIQMGNTTCDARKKNYMGNLKSETFKDCNALKYLSLQNTQIATLPSGFDCLTNIEVLDLSDNLLTWLPECFCNLINLKMVNLTSNHLLFLPNNIGQLVNLTQIHLGSNRLYSLPESFVNLKKLEFVDLYSNQIENIDLSILKGKQLRGLDLGLNYLQFDFCGCNADEVKVLYNCKKDAFRNHFSNLGPRSDLQKTKVEFNDKYSENSDAHSVMGSFDSTSSLSDVEELCMNAEGNCCEDEDWERKDSCQVEEDELFDPNDEIKTQRHYAFPIPDFRENYCPAKGHMLSLMRTYVRNLAQSTKNEPVEEGQFDSD